MLRMYNIGPAFLLVLFISQSVLAVPGDTVKSFPSPYSCPQGLAYDGEYLWNVDRKSDMIYKIDPKDGSLVDSLPTPGYVLRGLTWDGKRLWCVDAEEELIYAINPATGIGAVARHLAETTYWVLTKKEMYREPCLRQVVPTEA